MAKKKTRTVYRSVSRPKRRSRGKSLTRAVDPIFTMMATFAPEVYTYFANGGGINGFAKAMSLKTGYDFATGQVVPMNLIQGWAPITLYKTGKKLPAFANKMLSRI